MLKYKVEYPVPIEAYTAEGQPLWLSAPSPLVEAAERRLPRGSRVVDIGAGRGANGMYLAMQGHEVFSVELSRQYISEGLQVSRAFGTAAMSHLFIPADMREFDIQAELGRVDAVFAIRSLQQVTMSQAHRVVEGMQAATKPGGFNAVTAYVARPDQQQQMPHLALFEPGQLDAVYEASRWQLIGSDVQLGELDYDSGIPRCQSTVDLIAAKSTQAS